MDTILHFTNKLELVKNIKTKNSVKLMPYLSRRCQEARQLLTAINDQNLKTTCLNLIVTREKEWEEAHGKNKSW